jgi:hypothetical protein
MNSVSQQRIILVLIYVSIAATTLPFVIPSTDFALRLVTTFTLYLMLSIILTQSLSTRRRVLIGLIIVSSALMTLAIALPSIALFWFLASMLAILGAILVAVTLLFSERL